MAIAFFVGAMLLAGHALSEWLWRREMARTGDAAVIERWERVASSSLVALAVWLAATWLLSAAGALARGPLLASAVIAAVGGAVGLWRLRATPGRAVSAPAHGGGRWALPVVGLALLPLGAWLAFVLWRGWLLPVLNHDALAYHLPKALLFAREGGYRFLDYPDFRVAYPPNYELLLSTVLIFEGSDHITEWLSVALFVLFLVLTAAMAERWWGRGLHVLGAVLLVAGSPVVLLHTGAHKNDLMANVCFVAAALWTGRWVAAGGRAPLLLVVLAVSVALGTKVHGAFLALGVGTVLAGGGLRHHRAGRRLTGRDLGVLAAASVVALLLLGSVSYVVNVARTGSPTGVPRDIESQFLGATPYGDWDNLWAFPYLLLTVPFSAKPKAVWVPWHDQYWRWPHWDLYVSHFGAPFTLLVVLLPLGVWRYRRAGPIGGREVERVATSAAILLTGFLMLPLRLRPLGMFMFMPRFFMFVAPVVANWTLVPLVRELAAAGRVRRVAASGLVLGCAAVLAVHAYLCAWRDTTQPWPYVQQQAARGGVPRVVHLMGGRACSTVDLIAQRDAHIAVHAGVDTCAYLVYGDALRRQVTFIPEGEGPARIPESARWVVVDRPLNRIWGHPDFKDLGQWNQYINQGPLSREDRRVFDQLRSDRRFRLLGTNKQTDQALFRRRPTPPE